MSVGKKPRCCTKLIINVSHPRFAKVGHLTCQRSERRKTHCEQWLDGNTTYQQRQRRNTYSWLWMCSNLTYEWSQRLCREVELQCTCCSQNRFVGIYFTNLTDLILIKNLILLCQVLPNIIKEIQWPQNILWSHHHSNFQPGQGWITHFEWWEHGNSTYQQCQRWNTHGQQWMKGNLTYEGRRRRNNATLL